MEYRLSVTVNSAMDLESIGHLLSVFSSDPNDIFADDFVLSVSYLLNKFIDKAEYANEPVEDESVVFVQNAVDKIRKMLIGE